MPTLEDLVNRTADDEAANPLECQDHEQPIGSGEKEIGHGIDASPRHQQVRKREDVRDPRQHADPVGPQLAHSRLVHTPDQNEVVETRQRDLEEPHPEGEHQKIRFSRRSSCTRAVERHDRDDRNPDAHADSRSGYRETPRRR